VASKRMRRRKKTREILRRILREALKLRKFEDTAEEVLKVLRRVNKPLSLKEINRATPYLTYDQVYHTLTKLVEKGKVIKRGRGKYQYQPSNN